MESTENQLDLKKLKLLIKKGIQAIPKDQAANEAIMVIGDTGVGKSTIMNFLAGNKLIVKIQGLKPKLMVDGKSNIQIGHQKYSETSIPTRTIIQNLAFYDCPGFRDNKGEEYQISNSFFVQRLLDIYKKVKIVLMVDESHISQTRADKLPRLTKNLLKSFKSFEQIKQGVILIINRADRDLGIDNYLKEINKMIQLKNQTGFLFQKQQQDFLHYLVQNNRVKLFKMPSKQDRDQIFVPTQFETDILPSIRKSDFVKSKHILNIVSESAKIAIRDYIDNLTMKIDDKVERIAADISHKVIQKFTAAGKQISVLLEIKQQVMNLAEDVKSQKGENILAIIKKQLPNYNIKDFEQDFESILFFKGIYDKTSTYFSNLINKTYCELSLVLNKMDGRITKYQKQQKEELQKKQLLLRKKQIHNQKTKQNMLITNKIKQIQLLRTHIQEMAESSHIMIQSFGDTLSFLDTFGQQFANLKEDAIKMKESSVNLRCEFDSFSQAHIQKQKI